MNRVRGIVLAAVASGVAIGCGSGTPPSAPNPRATVPTVHDEKAVRLPMPPPPPGK